MVRLWPAQEEMQAFLRKEDTVIAAVSGGCDSVCLLLTLAEVRKRLPFTLRAVHVNHGIRGEEADGDEAYVQELCARLSVPCTAVRADVPAEAAAGGRSLEEAARDRRYRILTEEARKEAAPEKRVLIALAHHRDDQAETLLLNLFRGAGLRGLSGMRKLTLREEGIWLYRPFLDCSRDRLREAVLAAGATWREDSTNFDTSLRRNYIRKVLLPGAEERFPGAVVRLAETARLTGLAADYLDEEAEEALRKVKTEEGGLELGELRTLAPVLRQAVLRRWLSENGGLKDVTARHYEAAESLLQAQSGSSLSLPGGRVLLRRQEDLVIRGREAGGEAFCPPVWRSRTFSFEKTMEIPDSPYTKWMDRDKIFGSFSFRGRQEGDWFYLPDGGRKTVKSYLTERKIPAEERDRIPLLAVGSHVLWIVGWRLCHSVRITDATREVLEITLEVQHEEAHGKSPDS